MKLPALLLPPSRRLVNTFSSAALSQERPRSAVLGLKLTDPEVRWVLRRAWLDQFSTRSDFARTNAEAIALAALHGLITTEVGGNEVFGNTWRITYRGLQHLGRTA
jgi:hypothetical protein